MVYCDKRLQKYGPVQILTCRQFPGGWGNYRKDPVSLATPSNYMWCQDNITNTIKSNVIILNSEILNVPNYPMPNYPFLDLICAFITREHLKYSIFSSMNPLHFSWPFSLVR